MKLGALRVRLGLLAVTFVAVLWGFQAMLLDHAPHVFNAREEDMSFAWYVPLFSLYVLWTERKRLAGSLGAPSVTGLVAAVPFLALGFLGARGLQVRFEILSFAGLLVTIPWAFFGVRTAKRMLFPAGFLLFCIPLATFLDVVTVHLRIFASSVAFEVLRGFGADVVRSGTAIGAADGSFAIDVAEPCSGLRSIFALMALTAGYAYFNQPTWGRRAALFATSVPLAILGNVVRIFTICLVAAYGSREFATGFYHDYSGYVVFLVAILLMVAAGEVLTRCCGRTAPGGEPDVPDAEPPGRAGRIVPFAATALVVVAMVVQAATPEVTVAELPPLRLGEVAGFASERVEPGEAELTILPADTRIEKRAYRASEGDWFMVSLVGGGVSKSSIHRPELCLPAQGFQMTDPRTVEVDGTSWRFITLDGHGSRRLGFAYTFANQEGFKTSSHVRRIFRDILDRSLLNRIDRWVMTTVTVSRGDDASIIRAIRLLEEGRR